MDGEQIQLFGAPAGPIDACTLHVIPPIGTQMGRVAVMGNARNRQQMMTLTFDGLTNERMATAVGYAIPLIVKSHYVSANTLMKHFWRAYRTVSIAGWEATIKGCGKE